MNGELRYIGIDVGSTTVKSVVMDGSGLILWKSYERHNARQAERVRDLLARIDREFSGCDLGVFITGSGGRALAPHIGARYIQEVNAVTLAVERLYPDTGSVIELGGQDAKVILFKHDSRGNKSTVCYMNDKCAGGTGATLDKIFGKLGVSMESAAKIDLAGKTIHQVAAKCGVFAETDVVGLAKTGVDRDEIIVSLCAAVVKQNLEVLVRGNLLRDKVLLLGGPHSFIRVLPELWRKQIPELWALHSWKPADLPIEELIKVPPDSQYFAAIGAVIYSLESERMEAARGCEGEDARFGYKGIEAVEQFVSNGRSKLLSSLGGSRNGLISDEAELAEFLERYKQPEFEPPCVERGEEIPVWIGVDGGSTSSKLAVIDDSGELIYKDYMLSVGNPISDIKKLFSKLNDWTVENGCALRILGAAVTGYASPILDKAFDFDVQVVETVAHMRSAVHHYGEVDMICDVGGQDIKVLFMKHGRVADFRLNTQCSAGNGYFLQAMADQFGISIDEYAERAFRARRAPSFNYGCAVFMEQDKVNFQQLGWSGDEIMAGLALVLPLNIWNFVVHESNIAKFGHRIVLQGGTQKNLAAVKAQVDFIKRKIPGAVVHVHKHTDICGAIGAALEARSSMGRADSRFIGLDRASGVVFKTANDASTRCKFCSNRCPRTFVDISAGGGPQVRFVSGNACEKGASDSVEEMKSNEKRAQDLLSAYPNLAQAAGVGAFLDYDFEPVPEEIRSGPEDLEFRNRMVVGIPRLLNLFFCAPFFNAYLRTLGVEKVVYSGFTTRALWEEGNKWGSIDPCFPAKVAPAHIWDLLQRDEITHLLFPIATHIESHLENTVGNNACVIQMGTPEVVHAAFTRQRDHFDERGVELWKPFVRMDRPREASGQLFDYFRDRLRITFEENEWAVEQAYRAQQRYLCDLRNRGRRVIDWLVENDKIGIVVLGHPYHHDPGLNHGLLEEIQKRGYPILCIESLPTESDFLDPLFAGEGGDQMHVEVGDVWRRNFNRNTNHKIWAAKVVSRHPNLAAIDLSSFKCGHDAPTYSYIDNIMDSSETPHFLFHDIDQNKPHASMKIRIQTFDYFLKEEENRLRAIVKE